MINDLIHDIEDILTIDGAKSYNIDSDIADSYPYSEFDLKLLTRDAPITGSLEVNVWDSYKTYSRANHIMDLLEKKVSRELFKTDDFIIRMYKGQRQQISDPDKNIKRIREQFEIRIAERN